MPTAVTTCNVLTDWVHMVLGLNPPLCECALSSSCLITRAGPSTSLCMASRPYPMVASIFLPGRPEGKRLTPIWIKPHQNTFLPCECHYAGPAVGLSSMEGASFSLFVIVLLQNHSSSKDMRQWPASTSWCYRITPIVPASVTPCLNPGPQ